MEAAKPAVEAVKQAEPAVKPAVEAAKPATAKTDDVFGSIEEEMANLLGRPAGKPS